MSDNSLLKCKARSRRSFIWDYYTKLKDKDASRCNHCDKVCNMFSGNTSGLIKHLKNHHQQIYLEFKKKRINESTSASTNNTFQNNRSTSRKVRLSHVMTTRLKRSYKDNIFNPVNEDKNEPEKYKNTNKSDEKEMITGDKDVICKRHISVGEKEQVAENDLKGYEEESEVQSNGSIEADTGSGYNDQDKSLVVLNTMPNDHFQPNMGGDKRSFCWNFFTPILSKRGKQRSKCSLCRKVYQIQK